MTSPKVFPSISAVKWIAANEVLGGEASDFTPWLIQPESLEILGQALKLEELTAVEAEHNVLGKRLDILASALDEKGRRDTGLHREPVRNLGRKPPGSTHRLPRAT